MLGLDAAHGKHEAARRVAPVGADGHDAGHVEGGGDFSGHSDLDLIA